MPETTPEVSAQLDLLFEQASTPAAPAHNFVSELTPADTLGEPEAAPVAAPVAEPASVPVALPRTKEILDRARKERESRKYEQQLKQSQQSTEEAVIARIKQMAVSDPARFYREVVGVDPSKLPDIAAPLYYENLGDQAPEVLKHKNEMLRIERKLEESEQRLARFETEILTQNQQREVDAYFGQVTTFPEGRDEDYPFLSANLTDRPDATAEALKARALEYFQETGVAATPKQIAQALESDLEQYYTSLQSAYERKSKQAKSKTPSTPAKTTAAPAGLPPSAAALADAPARSNEMSRDEADARVLAMLEGRD